MAKPPFIIDEIERFMANAENSVLPQNPVFCMVPWIHFHVTQYGTVAPCCVAPWDNDSSFGDINTQTAEEIWNSEPIRNFRLKMLKGEPDYRCERCYVLEKAGNLSSRSFMNKLYAHHVARLQATRPDGFLPEYKPVYLDIRFSNKCNFKCRICGPHASSAWYDDALKAGLPVNRDALTKSITDISNFLAQLRPWMPELEEIYFAGGEPLFIDEHYALLDELLKAGKDDVLLRYSTNFSSLNYEKGKAINYWKAFKKVVITASFDDIGLRAELQRKGQNWKNTEQNIMQLKREAPHVHLMVSPTISVWNIWNICSLHRYMCEQGFIEADDFIPNVLEQPEYFSILVLPLTVKQSLAVQLKEHAQWINARTDGYHKTKVWLALQFERIADSLFTADRSNLLPVLLENIKQMDAIRNEDTFEIIPELKFLTMNEKYAPHA